jgi:hypothetical protein
MVRGILFALALTILPVSPPEELRKAMDGISELLPGPEELEGWRRKEVGFYDRSNLYEYIDGEAENFLVYKFVVAGVAKYLSESGDEMVVDVYDMGESWDAFGRYVSVRFPGAKRVDIGVEGFLNDFGLDFWKGRYYVKITVFKKEEGLISEVQRVGRLIASRIRGGDKPPAEISLFPKSGMVEGSERFIRGTVVGIEGLPHGFVARYGERGRGFYVILSPFDSPEDAKICLDKVRKWLGKRGRVEKRSDWDEAISGKMGYRGDLVLMRKGRFLVGAVGKVGREAIRVLEGMRRGIS